MTDDATRSPAGTVVIVSGSAAGQGAAEARLLAARGAQVVVGDVDDDAGRAVAANIGESASYHHLDVRSEDDWRATLAAGARRVRARHRAGEQRGDQHDPPVDHQDAGRRLPRRDRRQPDRRVHRHPRRRARDRRRRRRQHRERVVGQRFRGRVGDRGLRLVEIRAARGSRAWRRSSWRARGCGSTRSTPARSTPTCCVPGSPRGSTCSARWRVRSRRASGHGRGGRGDGGVPGVGRGIVLSRRRVRGRRRLPRRSRRVPGPMSLAASPEATSVV